ncbi:hypothetical protein CEUSTIGMA_g14051.t1 [Chlamydomonas eustigma]|uniref:Uncharacterized protein n=1 Tax=Chlamydomonas eustigma TaxID=1157962 RepID=A0A250XUE1_9CHLO|nr:hypothetical protein CEUSTIGMA_g14051.t1 [Chlamydomonas eustigma]|eukprot:GAX86643.1 hypothetical protein CEUSTIGMA_g14051.t1 [Chlamydomonas eustigma]
MNKNHKREREDTCEWLFIDSSGSKVPVRQVQHECVIDVSFREAERLLNVSKNTISLARQLFCEYYKLENKGFKGDSRRSLIVGACLLYASRDSAGGLLSREEICSAMLLDSAKFPRVCDDLRLSLQQSPKFTETYCFSKTVKVMDLAGKVMNIMFPDVKIRSAIRKGINGLLKQNIYADDHHALTEVAVMKRAVGLITVVAKALKQDLEWDIMSNCSGLSIQACKSSGHECTLSILTAKKQQQHCPSASQASACGQSKDPVQLPAGGNRQDNE